MTIDITAIRAFNDNYIWKLSATDDKKNTKAIIVDPGDASVVFENLEKHQQILTSIFITHHHSDHIGGVKALKKAYKCVVYGPANEAPSVVDIPLKQGDKITADNTQLEFKVIDVPGHTLGHIAYYNSSEDILFCGDTLFAGGCGRLFEGTAEQMFNSLDKLSKLPDSTRIYCAHEYTVDNLKFAVSVDPDNQQLQQRLQQAEIDRKKTIKTVPSLLALEKKTNPFLRSSSFSLKRVAESQVGHKIISESEVFAVIRKLKDHF